MKLFVKLMLALLVLAILLPFTVLKNKQGGTLMNFSDFSLPEFEMPGMPDLSPAEDLIPSQVVPGGMDTFYKWYDPKGNVQFTSEPPPDGVAYTVKQYDPNTNVIQAVKLPVEDAQAEVKESNSVDPAPEKSPPEQASPYDDESVGKLFEDVKNMQKLINQRTKSQNETIN